MADLPDDEYNQALDAQVEVEGGPEKPDDVGDATLDTPGALGLSHVVT